MKNLTDQDAFNKVWQRFIVEKHYPGYNLRTSSCTYWIKDPDAGVCTCAIGCILPEEVAKDWQEKEYGSLGDGISTEVQPGHKTLDLSIFPEEYQGLNYLLLCALQKAHDDTCYDHIIYDGILHDPTVEWAAQFKAELEEIAERYSLEIPS